MKIMKQQPGFGMKFRKEGKGFVINKSKIVNLKSKLVS